jgi:nucleotide-binding universal stress UspA family protein
MFRHLLIPLDGSRLAEFALPIALTLCQTLGSEITLIHIIERNPPGEIHGERHLAREEEAVAYLNQVARQNFPPGIKVTTHVHTEEEALAVQGVSNVARSIAEHASELAPDLIVMCTHGEGGVRDLVVGSIAQQVIGQGKTPILLLHPQNADAAPLTVLHSLLVALDGKPEHDQALQVAGELAKCFGASLHLLTVIPTLRTVSGEYAATSLLLPGTTSAMLNLTEEYTAESLEQRADAWRKQGLQVKAWIRRGDPVQQILAAANDEKVDLIVLGTHGKTGMGAFWAGSVAPKVVSSAHVPLLLVPAIKV